MITQLEIRLGKDDLYRVHVTKQFTEENGGGEATITLRNPRRNIHHALDDARSIVTLHRADRSGFEHSQEMDESVQCSPQRTIGTNEQTQHVRCPQCDGSPEYCNGYCNNTGVVEPSSATEWHRQNDDPTTIHDSPSVPNERTT